MLKRAERDAARKVLARGDDPAELIRLDRIAAAVAASNSFEAALVRTARGWRIVSVIYSNNDPAK